jgi:hypothetical protein
MGHLEAAMIIDVNQGLRAFGAKSLLRMAEARGFEPRMGANPNRISRAIRSIASHRMLFLVRAELSCERISWPSRMFSMYARTYGRTPGGRSHRSVSQALSSVGWALRRITRRGRTVLLTVSMIITFLVT